MRHRALPLGPGSPTLTLASPLSEAFQLRTLALALSTSCLEGVEPFPQEGELVSGLGPCLVASSDDSGEHSCGPRGASSAPRPLCHAGRGPQQGRWGCRHSHWQGAKQEWQRGLGDRLCGPAVLTGRAWTQPGRGATVGDPPPGVASWGPAPPEQSGFPTETLLIPTSASLVVRMPPPLSSAVFVWQAGGVLLCALYS